MNLINLENWSLIPGPLFDPPASSIQLNEITAYPPESVAAAILTFPGTQLLHSADPTWWDWSARWEKDGRWIDIGFSLFDTDPPAWGGSELSGSCESADLLNLWAVVRKRAPACWMHNSFCEIHSPESFIRLVGDIGGQ